jgi:NADH-quinone oxidoreductase subunit C
MGGDSSIILYLQQSLGGRILDSHAFRGDETIVITREGLLEVFRLLKEDPKLDFNFLTDITAVDYLGKKEPRFEVVYHFYSFRAKHRLRVKVGAPEEDPIVDRVRQIKWP